MVFDCKSHKDILCIDLYVVTLDVDLTWAWLLRKKKSCREGHFCMLLTSPILTICCVALVLRLPPISLSPLFCLFVCPPLVSGSEVSAAPGQVARARWSQHVEVDLFYFLLLGWGDTPPCSLLQLPMATLPSASGTVIWIVSAGTEVRSWRSEVLLPLLFLLHQSMPMSIPFYC